MDEFKAQGGALGGREERSDAFAGEPRAVGSTLGGGGSHTLGGPGAAGTTSVTDGNMNGVSGNNGTGRTNGDINGVSGNRGTVTTETRGNGLNNGMTQNNTGRTGSGFSNAGVTGDRTTTTGAKPSLKDRMNPKVDADGDGKAGFMN